MSLSGKCIIEIQNNSERAAVLARGSAKDRQESAVLLQKNKTLMATGISSDEARALYARELAQQKTVSEERYKDAFGKFLATGGDDSELRDLLAGTQTILYTAGPQGGYTVPIETEQEIFEALALTEELLDPDVSSFSVEPTPTLQPKQLTGYDLSTIQAAQILEATQQTDGAFPTVAGRTLRGNIIFKVTLGATLEAETDVPDVMSKMARAMGIGFARELGVQICVGNGTTSMQGLLTALPTPVWTTSSGKLQLADFNGIFFSVNKAYRNSEKCAWAMSDSVYQRVRNSTDPAGRPLLDVLFDGFPGTTKRSPWPTILGKPVYICPNLGALVGGSLATNSTIVFGDFSHYHIRCSRPMLQRVTQSSIADITQGKTAFVGRIRADAALFDPSNGTAPPLVSATVSY